ncbi:MAG: kelch motif-containing protein, partial [Thermoplasmata archaeon]|nr:kelch motif-containing protein [Thermoplasmata archaeon]
PSTAPSPRYGATFADDHWDANLSRKNSSLPDAAVVLFGGETSTGQFLNDTWVFSDGVWAPLSNAGTPSPYGSAFAAIGDDETDGSVEMFGGTNGNAMADFWTFF